MNIELPDGQFKYIYNKYFTRFLLVAIIIIIFLMFYKYGDDDFWDISLKLVTIITLGVTSFVWFQQIRAEWKEDYLPKRFSGKFYFKGKEVIRFENAELPNKAELRALAQQIALQMVGLKTKTELRWLHFVAPAVEVTAPQINKKERFIHYAIKVNLTILPEGLNENETIIWRPPFTKENGEITELINEKNA